MHSVLKPRALVASSSRSEFAGLTNAFRRVQISTPQRVQRAAVVPVESKRVCDLTGKKRNNGFSISFSHKRNKKVQNVNLQKRKIYWPEGQRWVKMKISTKALRTIEKKGLNKMADDAGIDLWKLPFVDCRPERIQYLKEHPMEVPTKKNPGNKKMKNPERLAASRKTPVMAKYLDGRIVYVREGMMPDEKAELR
ncbi:hypothetical protein BSKO_09174 [Bryopsis sp. KO-2023]|nr:hypothetical protein BSKO_09174 [Bryopsis sp. KO-2023]